VPRHWSASAPAMSEVTTTPAPVALSLLEQRILGSLVEKQKTTADAYPMSVNALVAACNQKSNRDPLLSVSEDEVEVTLEELNRRNLVVRVVSGRVDKWKHVLYEHWQVEKVELAVLAELFLRGPQTEGELRSRVSRMDAVSDLDAMRDIVRRLADRGLAVYLTPEGRRGTVVTHAFQDPGQLAALVTRSQAADATATVRDSPFPGTAPVGPAARNTEFEELRKEVAELRHSVVEVAARLDSLCRQLGVSPPTPTPPAP
jgi:uncharacterized protein YceH (UPF0502 family)